MSKIGQYFDIFEIAVYFEAFSNKSLPIGLQKSLLDNEFNLVERFQHE